MKYPTCRSAFGALVIASIAFTLAAGKGLAAEGKTRVLLVHGGHDFETNQFLQVFRTNPAISFQVVAHPRAQTLFAASHAGEYDVLLFYDLWQDISERAKADLIDRLKEGKGLVALHHCLASYQGWDEYPRIIGGKYHLKPWRENETERAPSTFKHDVDFAVRIADPSHPITRGLHDFTIHDETYGGCEVRPDSHALLKTDDPTSTSVIGWCKMYEAARVVYLQLGHDHKAYENPNYQQLVRQAIEWAAKRSGN